MVDGEEAQAFEIDAASYQGAYLIAPQAGPLRPGAREEKLFRAAL